MSGHSKWATIHRQKEVKDAARGQLFSKLGRAITIAVKTGGGPEPDSNFKLRVEMDHARAANMPKENIERAIEKGKGSDESLEEVSYEGFGPNGISVIVQVATDNRNRTGQGIKNLFERSGGRLGGPGAVSYNFEPRGMIVISKNSGTGNDLLLKLIDVGVEDYEETEDAIEAFVNPGQLSEVRKKIIDSGITLSACEIIQHPKNFVKVGSKDSEKILTFLNNLNDHEDVQKVFANVDFDDV